MANNKNYEIAFQLGAKVQSSMGSAFGAAQKNMNNLNKGMQQVNKQSNMISKAMGGIGTLAKAALGAAAAAVSINAIKDFAKGSIDAARSQIEQETKLEAVLKNVKALQAQGPEAYKNATKQLVNMAGVLENVGVIEGDVALAGYQQLATFQLTQKQIGLLSKGMGDLLAQQNGFNATGQDAVGIANMMGKVMDGNVSALSRVGISFTKAQEHAIKFGDKTQRAAVLAEVLQQNVGGVNEALRNTDEGKIKAQQMAWGEMQETIGRKLLPLQAKFAGWFATKIPLIQNALVGVMDKLQFGIDYAAKLISKYKPVVMGMAQSVMKAAAPIINSIVSNVKTIIAGVKPIVMDMVRLIKQYWIPIWSQVFGFVVNTVIPKVQSALGQFIPKIISIFQGLWSVIGPTLESWYSAIMTALPTILKIAGAVIDKLIGWFGGLLTAIDGIVQFISGAFAGNWEKAWNGIRQIFLGIWQGWAALLKEPLNIIINMINNVIRGINSISVKVPDWSPVAAGKTWGPNIPQIPALANGGIVKRPTFALLGEAGSEAVIPLDKGGFGSPVINISQTFNVDGGNPQNIYDAVNRGNEDLERRMKAIFRNWNRLSFSQT